jgi:hypothetical protein
MEFVSIVSLERSDFLINESTKLQLEQDSSLIYCNALFQKLSMVGLLTSALPGKMFNAFPVREIENSSLF